MPHNSAVCQSIQPNYTPSLDFLFVRGIVFEDGLFAVGGAADVEDIAHVADFLSEVREVVSALLFESKLDRGGVVDVGLRADGGDVHFAVPECKAEIGEQIREIDALDDEEDLKDLPLFAPLTEDQAELGRFVQIILHIGALSAVQSPAVSARDVSYFIVAGNRRAATRQAEKDITRVRIIGCSDLRVAVI